MVAVSRAALEKQRAAYEAELSRLRARAAEAQANNPLEIVPIPIQNQIAEARRELAEIGRQEAALADRQAAENAAVTQVAEQARREESAFWFRRFFTSLAIGHGAAFAALAGGVLQADDPEKVAGLAAWPLVMFASGVVTAGLVPFALYLQSVTPAQLLAGVPEVPSDHPDMNNGRADRFSRALNVAGSFATGILAFASASAFVLALTLSVIAVHGLAEKGRGESARGRTTPVASATSPAVTPGRP